MSDTLTIPNATMCAFLDLNNAKVLQQVCDRNKMVYHRDFAGAAVKLKDPNHPTKGVAAVAKLLVPEKFPVCYPFSYSYGGVTVDQKVRQPGTSKMYDLATNVHANLSTIRKACAGNIKYARLRAFAIYSIDTNPKFDLIEIGRVLDNGNERPELLNFLASIGRLSKVALGQQLEAEINWDEIRSIGKADQEAEHDEEEDMATAKARENAFKVSKSLILAKIILTVHKQIMGTTLKNEPLLMPMARVQGMMRKIESSEQGLLRSLI